MAQETPIYDALLRHLGRARGPLHVPGHQQGSVLPAVLDVWFGRAAKLDLTELPGLDNLAQPEECILASERLAASYYGSDECLYCVNGSSAGIMAALMAATTSDTTVLFVNGFHTSAWYGLVHSGAKAVRLPPLYDKNQREVPADPARVREMLTKYPEVEVVYVTSPTYQGDCSDVAALAEIVHKLGLMLIVDEAHGAHFGLIPEFPQHSVKAGADIVVQSVHKMLPGLTQTAWIHRQGQQINGDDLAQALRSLQTSSPSYLLLASLDAVQYWLRTAGPQVASQTVRRLEEFGLLPSREDGSRIMRDPLKHWVSAPAGTAAIELQKRLLARGLYPEYVDETGVLSILGLGLRAQVQRDYKEVLQQWERWLDNEGLMDTAANVSPAQETRDRSGQFFWDGAAAETFVISPRTSMRLKRERVGLSEAIGRLAAVPLSPYPPGVPIVYPGQELTQEVVSRLETWQASGRKVQGVHQGGRVDVLCDTSG